MVIMRDLGLLRVAALLAGAVALAGCSGSRDPVSSSDSDTTGWDAGGNTSDTSGPGVNPTMTTGGEVTYCPCDWVDCGDAGECEGPVENPDRDEAVCLCPDGREFGFACYSCTPSAGSGAAYPLDINIRTIRGVLLVNNGDPPTDASDAGILSLRDVASGDRVEVGLTTSKTWSARVATRLYDMHYSVQSSAGGVPQNTDARIRRIPVDIFGSPVPPEEPPVELFVNVLSGPLQINGVNAPQDAAEAGNLFLRSVESGERIAIGSTSQGAYEVGVHDGVYELIYEAVTPGNLLPINSRGVVTQFEISSTPETFPLSIPVAALTLNVTVNGGPPPSDETDYGMLYLRDTRSGGLTMIGDTRSSSHELNVLPGSYEIVYTNIASADAVPVNKHARVGEAFEVGEAPATLDVDIPMVQASGVFTVGGATPPTSGTDDGVLTLESVDGRGTVALGNTSEGQHDEWIIPGSYDIYYAQETAGQLMPQNTHAFVDSAPDFSGGTLDINIPVITISGELRLSDGAAVSELEDGRVFLRDESRGDSVLLGTLSKGEFTRRIVPGSFTAHYAIETGGAVVPANANARISDQAVALEQDVGGLVYEVPVTNAVVEVTYNELPPPTDKADYGAIFLESVETGDEIYLGDTTEGTVGRRVVAGDYLIRYRRRAGGLNSQSPQNENVSLDCVQFIQ